MLSSFSIAALGFALACFWGERVTTHANISLTPHQLVRAVVGSLLLCSAVSVGLLLLVPRFSLMTSLGISYLVVLVAQTALWREQTVSARACNLVILNLLIAHACLAEGVWSLLIAGVGLSVAYAIGLPAFRTLAHRLDDQVISSHLYGWRARGLITVIMALGIAGIGMQLS